MVFNLRDRHFLKLLDFTPQEIKFLLELSANLKKAKYAEIEQPRLRVKNIALIFEKSSTRTRCAFEVAAYDQGAHATYLRPSGSQMGAKKSKKDTAGCWAACTTALNTAFSVRLSSRGWPNMPVFRCGTA